MPPTKKSSSTTPAPGKKRIRFLVSIASHDWSAIPGEIQELPAELADKFADGQRAILVDEYDRPIEPDAE